jgi:hypothetical protein
MKALGAFVGFLLVAIAALVVVPRFRTPGLHERPAPRANEGPRPLPEGRIALPPTPDQKLREETTRQRLPFFQSLRARYSREISSFGVTQAIDTLDIVVTDPDPEAIQKVIAGAISPTAGQYGFSKVRTFIANPTGSVEPLKLVAESTYDGAGRWNTFLK